MEDVEEEKEDKGIGGVGNDKQQQIDTESLIDSILIKSSILLKVNFHTFSINENSIIQFFIHKQLSLTLYQTTNQLEDKNIQVNISQMRLGYA